jgi:RNA polymerase primary sigma factor
MTTTTYQYPDLTADKYLREISNYPILSRAEEMTLIPAAKAGDKIAHDKVIRSNLRFVVKIAKEYKDKGMTLVDLIGEGNLGLFRAMESFDPGRGIKFITYAKWWIRQSIIQALIYKSHLVRIPQSQLRRLRRTNKIIQEMSKKINRIPTDYEIESSLETGDAQAWMMAKYFQHQQSLDEPLSHDDADTLVDILADKEEVSPDTDLNSESLRMDIDNALSILRDREIEIIRMLFGLETGKKMTLGEVGAVYSISKERVRQIKDEALNKLRNSKVATEALRLYLN